MAHISAGLKAAVLSFAVVLGAGATAAQAQGLVTTQKLSASLANELVGETVAICAQKGQKVSQVGGSDRSRASRRV
jgi:hypothetical protein